MENIVECYLDYLQEGPATNAAAGAVGGAVANPLLAAGVGLSAANLLLMGIRTYKDYFTKVARQCADLTPGEKAICMTRAKMLAKNAQLQTIKSKMNACAKAKDPQKCKGKLVAKMKSLADEVKFFSDRFKALKQKETAQAKPQPQAQPQAQ
jgi:hypothetical protein